MIDLNQFKGKRVHFIGIGGCSMSGLAQILKANGYQITGSDLRESPFTEKLKEHNIPLTIGHSAENIAGADLAVYTAAVQPTNPEYAYALAHGIPLVERSVLLGILSSHYAKVACISGCHGKTTITSMLALIMQEAEADCTIHVGGMVDFLGGGVKIGSSDIFITEACEYVKSFLTLSPKYILVNNIDDDHLDFYKDIEEIYQTFVQFIKKLDKSGILILNAAHPLALRLASETDCRIITFGTKESDWNIESPVFDEMGSGSADIVVRGEKAGRLELNIPGLHNLYNALAAVLYANEVFGIPIDTATAALAGYRLAGRRFELMGVRDGVKIFHDYAHHPSEIAACLQAAARYPHKKLWAVFQCNSFTRARTLKVKFGTSFGDADEVLVPDLFPGRDIDRGDIHAADLVQEINSHSHNARYIPTFQEIRDFLLENWQEGDIVVTLGSGDVYKQQQIFFKED
jgi:UDP-N-acetylmuramate--alanine ligase